MKKNISLMSISAITAYVSELEAEVGKIDALAKVVVDTEASLSAAHEHIKMLEKELQVGAKKVPLE